MGKTVFGKQSISFREPVYIQGFASVVGKKEGEGPLGDIFDRWKEMINSVKKHGKKRKAPCSRRRRGWQL